MHEKMCAHSESHLSIDSRCLCSQSDCEFVNSQPLGQPRSQGLSSSRPLEREKRDPGLVWSRVFQILADYK